MAEDSLDEHGLPLWPAAERNKGPILEVLQRVLPERGWLLEVASGTGQHALAFASALSGWTIQPSDVDPENLETLRRRVSLSKNPRLLPPLSLDVTEEPPALTPTAIFCANMIHIAPWAACVGLFRLADQLLADRGQLVTYGPYSVQGTHTAESNARFDQSLRNRDPEWGVRDLDDLKALAQERRLFMREVIAMPANNLVVVWQRVLW